MPAGILQNVLETSNLGENPLIKNVILSHEQEWNLDPCYNMEVIMLSDISQTRKDECGMIPLI